MQSSPLITRRGKLRGDHGTPEGTAGKEAKFKWDKEREEANSHLMNILSSTTTLGPFVMERPTHFVCDASPEGIQASLYQEQEDRGGEEVGEPG